MPKNIIRAPGFRKMAVLAALAVLAAACAAFLFHKYSMARLVPVHVYRVSDSGGLRPETQYIPNDSNNDQVRELLTLFLEPPGDKSLTSPVTGDIEIVSGQIVNDTVLEIEFSPGYKQMQPLDELLFRSALVWTMTGLDFIKGVHFYIGNDELLASDGKPFGIMGRSTILVSPVISPEKTSSQFIKLYFADNASMLLVSEMRLVDVSGGEPIEKDIVGQLIAGTKQKLLNSLIPPGTKLLGVETENGVCYVNLSTEFISDQTGNQERARLSVFSIVDSLTEIPDIRQVQFLIDSEKIAGFSGGMDISGPIDRNTMIILK